MTFPRDVVTAEHSRWGQAATHPATGGYRWMHEPWEVSGHLADHNLSNCTINLWQGLPVHKVKPACNETELVLTFAAHRAHDDLPLVLAAVVRRMHLVCSQRPQYNPLTRLKQSAKGMLAAGAGQRDKSESKAKARHASVE
eukprot:6444943-Amphidinium_carterae.2